MDPEDESLQMRLLQNYTDTPVRYQLIYKLLLDRLCAKDFKSFESLVESSLKKHPSSIDLNHKYANRSDETLLDIACKKGLSMFVNLLLSKGAKVNRVNEAHGRGPIHFATENGHVDVLGILLDEPTINPNLEAGQQTALHIAVKKNHFECAELLLRKGASPNIPNSRGLTALHMAAMKAQTDMVKLILNESKHNIELDRYPDYNNQTTRDVLRKKLADISLPPVQERDVNVTDLKYYLNVNDEANFLKNFNVVQDNAVENAAEELIEMAAERNFKEAITALLERTKGTDYNLEKAANIAIQQGSPNILSLILNRTNMKAGKKLLLNACTELGIPGKEESSRSMSNRLECLKLILENTDEDVRCTDSKGNTPLHYAARANCREAVTLLLEKGSYIGQINNFQVPAVADISVSSLSQHFDDCIQAKKERTNEYTIEFDYKCLMPCEPNPSYRGKNAIGQRTREMDVFQYIADSTNLKPLLKHPLLSSFVYLKWHKIRHLFYLKLILYVLFYLSVNMYILHEVYANKLKPVDSRNSTEPIVGSSRSTINVILQIFTGIFLLFLAFRETLQLISFPCYYVSKKENWIEMMLIVFGLAILCGAGSPVGTIMILLSAWELVILISQHPRMSTGIEMFKTVLFNFVHFLFPYAFLILAFSLAFFTLFKDTENNDFLGPERSVFKTIIMLTGEFDANNIPFESSYPVLSHLVFVFFVFLIPIVLINLLNGLAVSDTADILGKAELVGLISRVRVLSYIENMTVDSPLVHGSSCYACYGVFGTWNWKPLAFLGEKILLFPTKLKNGKLSVQLYDNKSASELPNFRMESRVIKQAKEILLKRGQESDSEKMVRELELIKERLALIEENLNAIKLVIDNNNINITKDDGN